MGVILFLLVSFVVGIITINLFKLFVRIIAKITTPKAVKPNLVIQNHYDIKVLNVKNNGELL